MSQNQDNLNINKINLSKLIEICMFYLSQGIVLRYLTKNDVN